MGNYILNYTEVGCSCTTTSFERDGIEDMKVCLSPRHNIVKLKKVKHEPRSPSDSWRLGSRHRNCASLASPEDTTPAD